jgi:cell division inhibitor SepF
MPTVVDNPDGLNQMATFKPKMFNDIKTISESYKQGIPVLLLLSFVKKEGDKQRIFDYCHGLVSGLDGRLESVAPDVFVLTPYNYAPVIDLANLPSDAKVNVQ